MKKRIGNDLHFTWHIYRKDGDTRADEDFTGKMVEVRLLSPLHREAEIEDVTVTEGVVTFTFRGRAQKVLGSYTAVLYENREEDGMVTLDTVEAVTLVPHSYMEDDGDDGDVIEAASVELESEITQGADSYTKTESDERYVRQVWNDDHGASYFYPGSALMQSITEGVTTHQADYTAGGWMVWDGTDRLETFNGTIYKGGVATPNSTKVVWEKTATTQIPAATSSSNGLMSAEDKSTIDSLADVATSGSYNDLDDKPTIPAAQVQSDWNEADTASKAYIQNKPAVPSISVDTANENLTITF